MSLGSDVSHVMSWTVFCTAVVQQLGCFGGLFSWLLFGNDPSAWNGEVYSLL